ncbi:MAG: glutamate--tRNA ligase [Saprospirales bacterium]|nr:MAG: glutamate--tRNA ligase [Saprospirales bacterium]
MTKIRVRFAPSPTGPLHIGGLRTALYNYLFVKSKGGQMVLRIEDTDRKRRVEGAEAYIQHALNWCGINYDEGPDKGGILGPYRQSDRWEVYKKFAMEMVEKGSAYIAFDTEEELEQMREQKEAEGIHSPKYDSSVRDQMKNSLTLSSSEVERRMNEGEPHVIRFKIPQEGSVAFEDLIRGEVEFNFKELDDKVLIKADGWPTYHMANVVDDYLMRITHVIRGEEWLSSTGLHILLYEALGWKRDQPTFAHLPLILKPSGKGKLSKRDGAKFGIPVFPMQWKDPETSEIFPGFKERGFSPEALVNFIAFLGWNPGGEREIYSLKEMGQLFSLDKVSKGGARFDYDKALWFNQQHLMNSDIASLAKEALPYLNQKGFYPTDMKLVERVCSLMKERIQLISELPDAAPYFFSEVFPMDDKTLEKRWKEHSGQIVENLIHILEGIDSTERDVIESTIKEFIADRSLKMGEVLPLLRLSLTGTMKGPDVFDTISLLGLQKSIDRLRQLLEKMNPSE